MKTLQRYFYTLLLMVLSTVFFSSCSRNVLRDSNASIGKYDVANIDGCQYIVVESYRNKEGVAMAHKGNCNNPIHNRR
ncbi:hypothetical protein [Telluribacter sp.]|uniref:hypothetical protein n=1 Tax=Telluribacter sp. TaxID=1978767 RepID=UPI002E162372|nr:hypothetical protein [Telluribacter sp.]